MSAEDGAFGPVLFSRLQNQIATPAPVAPTLGCSGTSANNYGYRAALTPAKGNILDSQKGHENKRLGIRKLSLIENASSRPASRRLNGIHLMPTFTKGGENSLT